MIRGYCGAYGVEIDDDTLWAEAIEWQATRGSRSGRVAWQYFCDLAGRRGVSAVAVSPYPVSARMLRRSGMFALILFTPTQFAARVSYSR